MTETRHPLRRQLVGLIVVVLIAGVTIGVLIGTIGPQLLVSGGHNVRAVFANTQQLEKGDEVRVSGVDVGLVTGISLNPGGHSSTVTMHLNAGTGPMYADASALLQWKTLLGSAFYVNLNRGSVNAGSLGGREIQEGHTGNQVELEDITSVDSGDAEQGMKTLLPQLATGLSDPAPLARSLSTLGAIAPTVATGVGALRGENATRDYDLQGLVSHTAGVLEALNAPDHELQGLIQGAAATLGVTAARASDLESALDEATPALDQTRTTFAQLNTTLSLAHPLLSKLDLAAPTVAPAFRDVRPTLVGADTLLHRAVPLLRSLPTAAGSLASASQVGLPLLDEITPDFNSLADTVLPYLNTMDPQSQHTTAEMIGPTFEALGPDIAGQMDQNGHFIRFPASTGSSPVYLNCQENLTDPSATSLLACESLQSALTALFSYNPASSALQSAASAGSGAAAPSRRSPPSGAFAGVSASSAAGSAAGSATSAAGSTVASTVNSATQSVSSSVGSVLSSVSGSLSSALGSH